MNLQLICRSYRQNVTVRLIFLKERKTYTIFRFLKLKRCPKHHPSDEKEFNRTIIPFGNFWLFCTILYGFWQLQ